MGRLSPRLFWLGSVSSFMGLLSLLCLAVVPATEAQYIQDWDLQPTANGGNTLWWRPNINSNAGPVHYFDNNAVFLTYNCYYMTAICRNARNFLNSPRGLARPYPNMFSYDFGQCRTSNHRRASCLSSWAIYNPCPATGQPTVHRQDGPGSSRTSILFRHPEMLSGTCEIPRVISSALPTCAIHATSFQHPRGLKEAPSTAPILPDSAFRFSRGPRRHAQPIVAQVPVA